jgi:hypothetical protein
MHVMIQALRVAVQVPEWLERRREGRVHSRFAGACNLAWGDDLISLVLPAHGMVPGGMTVALLRGLCQGAPVTWDAGRQALQCGDVAIGLSAAEVWSNLSPLDELAPAPLLTERLRQVAELVRQQGRGTLARALSGAPTTWGGYALQQVRGLCQAVRTGDTIRACDTLGRILGLGEGLTPTGDDCLIGLLAVLHFGSVGMNGAQAPCARRLAAEAARRAPRATTPISAGCLRLAAHGGFSERAEAAVLGLLAAESGDWLAAASALIASGHSSGTDTLVGILCGAGVLHPDFSCPP